MSRQTKHRTDTKKTRDKARECTAQSRSSLVKDAFYLTESLRQVENDPNIFHGLTESERERILEYTRLVEFASGDRMFSQGEDHSGIFIIRSGLVRTFHLAESGKEITLGYWTAGHFVGGPELFGSGRHRGSGEAIEATVVYQILPQELRELIDEIPGLAINIIEMLVYKAKSYLELLHLLGTRSASNRLGHLLLTLSNRMGSPSEDGTVIEFTLTHQEMANMIGSTRQWVAAMLQRFEREGIVRTEGHRIVITDIDRLRDI